MTGVVITALIWLGVGFIAGTLDMMSVHPLVRFGIVLLWSIFQVGNVMAWAVAYEDMVAEKRST